MRFGGAMKTTKQIISLLLLTCSSSVLACERPALLEIPDGEQIRGRAKRQLQDEMLSYITEIAQYVACVRQEYAAANASEASDETLAEIAGRHNSAVAEVEQVAATYAARVEPIEQLLEDRQQRRSGANGSTFTSEQTAALAKAQSLLLQSEASARGSLTAISQQETTDFR